MAGNEKGKGTAEAARLEGMSLGELKTRYREVTGKPPAFSDRKKLIRVLAGKATSPGTEIAHAEQPAAKKTPRAGGRARAKTTAKGPVVEGPESAKPRTLSPGVKLTRVYKGKKIVVVVMEGGRFEWDGKFFASLSALANEVTGSHVSGVAWFGLKPRAKKAKKS